MRLTFFEEWADIEQMGIPTLDDYTRAFAELEQRQTATNPQPQATPGPPSADINNYLAAYGSNTNAQYTNQMQNMAQQSAYNALEQQGILYSHSQPTAAPFHNLPWVYRLSISNDYRGQLAHIDHIGYATPEERAVLLASGWYPTPDDARRAVLGS